MTQILLFGFGGRGREDVGMPDFFTYPAVRPLLFICLTSTRAFSGVCRHPPAQCTATAAETSRRNERVAGSARVAHHELSPVPSLIRCRDAVAQ